MVLLSLLTGCATPFKQGRRNDAADIFTATVGYGAGAKARVGPVNVGLLAAGDQLGFRKGCHVTPSHGLGGLGMMDLTCTLLSYEAFGSGWGGIAKERAKYYEASGICALTWGKVWGREDAPWNAYVPYYTQIDVVVAPGGSLRLGFNPGELVDFLLGWITLDIFSDDIASKGNKTKSITTAESIRRPADGPPKPSR